jgi:tetratricopeptide (TPR) repeat protein
VVGVEGSAAREFSDMLASSRRSDGPTFARYSGALVRHIESTKSAAPAVFIELARVLSDRMDQADQALAWLERGLALHPEDADLHAELAERLISQGQFPRAMSELERVVGLDIQRAAAWRQIAEVLKRMQRAGDGSVGVAPLLALGLANDLERSTWAARTARTAAAVPGSFGRNEFAQISLQAGEDAAAGLIDALGDIVGKVFPPELERWGVSSRDRLSAKSGNPLRLLADRVAQVFGLGDYELYVHRAHAGLVELELTDPVSVMVPAAMSSLSEAEQAFLLARAFASAARGLAAVERLAPPQVSVLLAASARLVEPNYGSGEHDEEYLAGQARRLSRALPWLGRGPIEDAARAYVANPVVNISDWIQSVRITSARAASVVADDLPSSVQAVRRLEGDLSGAEGVAREQGMRIVHDIVRFWVNESAFALRRRLGLA